MLTYILNELANKIFNEGFAWLSVALGGVLALKYIVRKCIIKSKENKKSFIKLNKYMKSTHIYLGVALIITGLVHGLFSSQSVFSINLGTLCWISSILLGISWAIRKKLKNPSSWIKYHRALTVLFIVTLGLHLFDIKIYSFSRLANDLNVKIEDHTGSGVSQDDIHDEDNKDDIENKTDISEIDGDLDNYTFKDGTYEGVADGYGRELTLKVTLKNNKIINIEIVSHNEVGENHYGRAMEVVPKEIIDNQSVDVDTISGATYTSNGIMNAVKNALLKAVN